MKSIVNGRIYKDSGFLDDHVLVFSETIESILTKEAYEAKKVQWDTMEEVDAQGHYVVPGFIDVHIHGFEGNDVMNPEVAGIQAIAKGIVKNGVTAFLPTTMTMPMDRIEVSLKHIRDLMGQDTSGAMVLGAHLEGPYIHRDKKGAQPEAYIRVPDPEFIEAYKDVIQVVTIAPEVEGAKALIARYGDQINFSLGHTTATYQEAKEAYEAGAKSTTHLFNAMTGFHHRDPGVVGAALKCDCYVELIADNIHVHPAAMETVSRIKSEDKVLLITDCMEAGGMPDGTYTLGGQEVFMADSKCTLADGTIAGSVLTLNKGLKNYSSLGSEVIDPDCLAKNIKNVTANQATYLGVDHLMGTLEVGKLANIVILDQDIHVVSTYVKGYQKYENQL